ncbi:Glycosyl transferases group 1 [Pseudoduganella namucuonensis]|uniref:Glycosyl transferases group 1 n=2 Tax=Pseudoduganella namucuonensis TaxID=1035707 RepID=A0A1I7M554_9BURK|nr:Glycosyl transferases group 1 [Pseudoduganella namucuonensis]
MAWLFAHGLREHGLLDAVDADTRAALDAPADCLLAHTHGVADEAEMVPTWLMYFVWRSDAALRARYDLRQAAAWPAYRTWFLLEGVGALQLAPLVGPRWRDWLWAPSAGANGAPVAVPRWAWLAWCARRDLQQAFDLATRQGGDELRRWARAAPAVEAGLAWLAPPPCAPTARVQGAAPLRAFGVNLIGFAFGDMGVGEDVRMAVRACELAGIPFAVLNLDPGAGHSQGDRTLVGKVGEQGGVSERAPFAVNVFCLTAIDTARALLEFGPALFAGRVNVGWWPWELTVWPAQLAPTLRLVDEIWSSSRFTRDAMQAAARGAPAVSWMPLPAVVDLAGAGAFDELDVPPDCAVFLFIFDYRSSLARKNPQAVVDAFRLAFGPDDAGVVLVLKAMNVDLGDALWQALVRRVAGDSRIRIVMGTLPRVDVLRLVQACDVYVSLHRAEGFGRTLAEALLMGKPVVATDFSGSRDFLLATTGFPVRWRRTEVGPGEYPFVAGGDAAWWAEPDLDHAAEQLRLARKAIPDPARAARVRAAAAVSFSPQRIGQLMRARLMTITPAGPE